MSKTRFTKWIVLGCIGTLAACTSGDGDTAGNTELNVVIPNGFDNGSPDPDGNPQPGAVDIQTVEYTIRCNGNDDVFLDNDASFDDAVTLNGNLEVNEADPAEAPGINPSSADVFQGFMDLPPGNCSAELRARDNDGEVICTAREGFVVTADSTIQVNLVMYCGLSFQAPVGMSDVAGTFSFNVANFCPDLMVLNCLESEPQEQPVPGLLIGIASTACEVRYRDGDSTCGTSCDPQTCVADGLNGLTCTPGPDPGVSTTVTCTGGQIDCDFDPLTTETECVFNGDQLGTLPVAGPIVPNVPPASAFAAGCIPPALGGTPGATVTCTAVTTDGDLDCDKTKVVSFTCPGLAPCDPANDPPPPACDGTGETHPECVAGACDDSSGSAVCVYTPIPSTPDETGVDCGTNPGAPGTNGKCDGAGVCVDFGCTVDADCDTDGNECTVAPPGACQADGQCLDEVDEVNGTACAGNTGTCQGGSCQDNCFGVTCPPNATLCESNVCNNANAGACEPQVDPAGTQCELTPGVFGACDGVGIGAAACVVPLVCEQYNPNPAQTGQTCDGSPGQECICEKPEFLAVDCELLGNSAPIPLAASVQQLGVAFAGQGIGTIPQAAVVLPSALICSFIGAGFTEAIVDNSFAEYAPVNASLASIPLTSFLDDGTAGGAPLSPHNQVVFDFGAACGDNCVGDICTSDGTTACSIPTFTQDCPGIGTGPGIIAPTFAGAPDVIIPPDFTEQVVGLAGLAQGTVDFALPYSGIALNLPAVGNPPVAAGCVGGACGSGPNLSPLCSPITRGALDSPRVMYDATCSKIQAGAGTCLPFNFFSTLGDVCKGAGIDGVADFGVEENLPACTLDPDTGDPICGRPTTPGDFFCTSATAVQQCCDQLAADFPNSNAAVLPQMPVN